MKNHDRTLRLLQNRKGIFLVLESFEADERLGLRCGVGWAGFCAEGALSPEFDAQRIDQELSKNFQANPSRYDIVRRLSEDEKEQRRKKRLPVKRVLENALRGTFPTPAELNTVVVPDTSWGTLKDQLDHYLINMSGSAEDFLRKYQDLQEGEFHRKVKTAYRTKVEKISAFFEALWGEVSKGGEANKEQE